MSACGEFAEHVWKPGSCKNCFHPRSAHRSSLSADDEDGLTSPSPYSKPTIAVRPTMMSAELKTDLNMNMEQVTDPQKSSGGVRKALDLPPLFIDSNGCNRALLQHDISRKTLLCSPTGLPKEPLIIGTIFVSQDGSVPKENGSVHSYRETSTYANGDCAIPNGTLLVEGSGTPSASPSPMTPDSFHESLSDSCSNRSSTDSLRSPQNAPSHEPIYAESTKRKKPPLNCSESSPSDNQKATITVMAAHTEENRTFYLSSPDSAVSTQWSAPTDTFAPEPRPQSSPPVPPKVKSRPPRLGTSSLSSAPLPELSFHMALPPKDAPAPAVRRSLEDCIDEEEELACQGPADSINASVESRECRGESRATPGTADKSASQTPAEDDRASREPEPPTPPPKKHLRVCSRLSGSVMDLERSGQQGSLENLSQSLRGLSCCTNASSDSLQALSDPDTTLRSSPSPFPSSPFGSAPASPQPDAFPSNSLAHQLQPPPLPQKKLVNRTVSAPSDPGVKPLARTRPRLPFSGSDTNVSRPSESLDGRLGSRGGLTSGSTPQLSALLAPAGGSTLQLHALLSNMDSREGIYSKLGGLYAESLRRLSLKCEEHFTGAQRNTLRFHESNWSLFKLTCNKPCCLSGDAVYYSASCASDTRNAYAVKICKGQASDSRQAHVYGLSVQQSVPPHFNLQQDCGHFIACVPQSMLPSEEPAPVSEQERVVVITREVPTQSVADFAREWEAFHRAQPEVYERRVCFLLLQLCTGLEHLKAHGVTHRDLCMENLLLVQRRPPTADPQQQSLPRLLISSFAKAKRRCQDETAGAADPRVKRDHARLAPEIVSAAQYRKFDEFQTGILIYELLHRRNPFEAAPVLRQQEYRSAELPPIPNASIYSSGLQRLAQLLLEADPGRRIHVQDARRILQALLWGPRRDLLEQRGPQRHDALLNWLDVKRALLMMKFAERSLEPERNAELEDWLCCQYFSSANPRSLSQTAELLYASG